MGPGEGADAEGDGVRHHRTVATILVAGFLAALGLVGAAGGANPIHPAAWTIAADFDVTPVAFLEGACSWTSGVAPDGTMHWATVDDGSMYHRREGAALGTRVSTPHVACEPPDLAFKPDGSPVLAWIDRRAEFVSPDGSGEGYDLYVASEDSGWQEVLVTGSTDQRVMRARIEVDALGQVHAAYIRSTLSTHPYNYALFASTSPGWQEDRVSDGIVQWYAVDLSLDSAGQGHVVWSSTSHEEVWYANESGGWSDDLVRWAQTGNTFDRGYDPDLEVDAADVVHVVWGDSRRTNPSGYPFFSEIWHASSADGFANSEVALPDDAAPIDRKWTPRLDFDAAGGMHLAFLGEEEDYVRNLYYSTDADWSRGVRVTNRSAVDAGFTDLDPHPFRFEGGAPRILFTDGRAGFPALWVSGPWDFGPDTSPPYAPLLLDRLADVGVGFELIPRGAWDNDRIASYEWDIGGTVLSIPQPWFVPTTAGTLDVRLTVRDPAGLEASSSFVLTVRPVGAPFWSTPRAIYSVPGARGNLELYPWTGSAFPLTWLAWGSLLSYHDAAGRLTGNPVGLGRVLVEDAGAWDTSGNLHLVGVNPAGTGIVYEKRRPDGSPLINPTTIPVGGLNMIRMDAAFAGGRVWVAWAAWSDAQTGDYEVYLAGLDLVGGLVFGPARLSNATGTSLDPALVPGEDRLWIAWSDARYPGSSVYGSALNLSTLAFDVAETRLADGYLMDAAPLPAGGIAVASGIPVEPWTMEVFLHRADAGGVPTGSPVRVSLDDGVWSTAASVETDGLGTAYVIWADTRNGTWIRFAEVPASGPPDPEGGAVLHRGTEASESVRTTVRLGPDHEPRVAFTHGTVYAATVFFAYRDPTPPVAVVEGPAVVGVGRSATFSGANSTDNAGILEYAWSVSDGGEHGGATANHTFQSGGTHTVRLTVRDGGGNSDSAELSVFVVDAPPVARIAGPPALDEDTAGTYSGTGSTDDGGIRAYEWTVTGPVSMTFTGPGTTITFSEPGTYTIRLTVTDGSGQTDSEELTIVVRDVLEPWVVPSIIWASILTPPAVAALFMVREWRRRGRPAGP